MNDVTICLLNSKPAVRLAARELSRYLARTTGRQVSVTREKRLDHSREARGLHPVRQNHEIQALPRPREETVLQDAGLAPEPSTPASA